VILEKGVAYAPKGTPTPGGYIKNLIKTKLYEEKVHEISIKTKQIKSFPIGAFCKKNIRKKNKPT